MICDFLIKGYLKADQFLVDRVNEAVKTWNWTTGKSRADLANIVNVVGSVLVGSSINYLIPVAGLNIFACYILNKVIDKDDKKSAETDLFDYMAEERKENVKHRSRLATNVDAISFCSNQNQSSPYHNKMELLSLGLFTCGLSEYIMRADYQAPGKSKLVAAVKKGLEKIAQGFQPAVQPIPETVNTGVYR